VAPRLRLSIFIGLVKILVFFDCFQSFAETKQFARGQVCCVAIRLKRLKVKGGVIALNGSPFQSYGASSAVWAPTMLPATRHK